MSNISKTIRSLPSNTLADNILSTKLTSICFIFVLGVFKATVLGPKHNSLISYVCFSRNFLSSRKFRSTIGQTFGNFLVINQSKGDCKKIFWVHKKHFPRSPDTLAMNGIPEYKISWRFEPDSLINDTNCYVFLSISVTNVTTFFVAVGWLMAKPNVINLVYNDLQ